MKPTDVKRFHDELNAALIAGVPMEIGIASGGQLNLNQLEVLRTVTERCISNTGDSGSNSDSAPNKYAALNQAIDSEPSLPNRYRAALHAFDQTGSMVPVLDGLSVQCIAKQQVSRVMRRGFIYLIVLLAVAVAGLCIFKSQIVPFIVDLRTEITQSASATAPEQFDETQSLALIITVISCLLALFVIWMLMGGASKLAMWLGGRHYLRCRTSTSAIRTLQLLLNCGMPVDDAVSVACDLTGAGVSVRKEVESAVQSSPSSQHLKSLADYLAISANRRLEYMRIAAPTTLVCSVGGIVSLVYCVAIFWPIIAMLRDLTTVGI